MSADSTIEFFHTTVKTQGDTLIRVCPRLCPGDHGKKKPKLQTLAVRSSTIQEIYINTDDHGHVSLGPIVRLHFEGSELSILDAAWDSFSSSLILITVSKVLQLRHDDTLHLLAGGTEELAIVDGSGTAAQFEDLQGVASDGEGHIYLADKASIRKLRLPATFQGTWQLPSAEAAAEAGAAAPSDDVVVTTLPFQAEATLGALAYVPCVGGAASSGGGLIFATETSVYRLDLSPDGDLSPGAKPEVLAGIEGHFGYVDGDGYGALFQGILGLAVDAKGDVYISDQNGEDGGSIARIRKLTCSRLGYMTTLVSRVVSESTPYFPSILPSGHLALAGDRVVLIDLKLQAPPLTASAAPPPVSAGPPPRSLPADLGALLDRQPDATSDVTLLVGDRSFAAHRGILAARSDYFRQRLEGDFADGSAAQLSLPDADPEAFEQVLRFIYTGRVSLPGPLARSVAELADRLLLPELCREAQARVLADMTAESVVDCLLWAESRGGPFADLLEDLKDWYLRHERAVVERALPSLKRLAVESPDLMLEFHLERGKRARVW